eukprot:s2095_g8.t1
MFHYWRVVFTTLAMADSAGQVETVETKTNIAAIGQRGYRTCHTLATCRRKKASWKASLTNIPGDCEPCKLGIRAGGKWGFRNWPISNCFTGQTPCSHMGVARDHLHGV